MQNLKQQNDEILSVLYEIRSMLDSQKSATGGDFIKLPEVIKTTGKKKTSIYQEMKDGSFPQQIRNGKEGVVWDAQEIAAWKEARKSKRMMQPANDN